MYRYEMRARVLTRLTVAAAGRERNPKRQEPSSSSPTVVVAAKN